MYPRTLSTPLSTPPTCECDVYALDVSGHYSSSQPIYDRHDKNTSTQEDMNIGLPTLMSKIKICEV